jgi:hypothetical protein
MGGIIPEKMPGKARNRSYYKRKSRLVWKDQKLSQRNGEFTHFGMCGMRGFSRSLVVMSGLDLIRIGKFSNQFGRRVEENRQTSRADVDYFTFILDIEERHFVFGPVAIQASEHDFSYE